jgi:prepilin peptidase CpaA
MNGTIFSVIAIELLIVAWFDLKKKKISNLWPLFNLALAIVFFVSFPTLYQWDYSLLLFPLGFIVGGFILFLMDIMGAGDSKYLASLFVVIPLDHQYLYFQKLVMMTLVVGSLLLLRSLISNYEKIRAYFNSHYWRGFKDIIRSRFSYAPVMLLAWLLLGASEWL